MAPGRPPASRWPRPAPRRYSTAMTDAELLDLAARLAVQAGHAILGVRRAGDVRVDHKSDRSPVTQADRIAEALITEGLRAALPDIPVVAEEEHAAGLIVDPAPRFWLVDALDGTRGFAAGNDEFAVCVGLVVAGRAHLGAVALPATGEIFAGCAELDLAWKRSGDAAAPQPIRVRAAAPAAGLTVLASRRHADDPRLAAWLAGRPVATLRPQSSALKFCRVAEGTADLYPRFGPTMEWDSCAGQALVEAAGGAVETLSPRAPLRYGKPGWLNPDFVCHGGAPA
jgi:3'(2'), 5'-bisphosphate nucleotidase